MKMPNKNVGDIENKFNNDPSYNSLKINNPTLNRRHFLAMVGGAGTVGMSGCLGSPSGNTSGNPEFIRYLGWGGNTQSCARKLFKKWSQETGIKVEHQSASGDAAFISILKQNPGKIDIVNFSSNGIAIARNEGLLGKVDYSKLPNYTENIQKAFRHAPYVKPEKQSDTVFRDPVTTGYAYNSNKTQTKLDSWNALLNDQFEGEIALRDDVLTRFGNGALAIGSNIDTIVKDETAYQKTVERLKKVDKNVFKYWQSGAQAIRLLREKRATIAEIWGGRTLALQKGGYEQMEYVIPKEGTIVGDENYCIPKASEKSEAVHELINWSFQRKKAIELSICLGYPIMLNNPPKEIKNMPDYVNDIDVLSWPTFDKVLPALPQMQRDFQKIKR